MEKGGGHPSRTPQRNKGDSTGLVFPWPNYVTGTLWAVMITASRQFVGVSVVVIRRGVAAVAGVGVAVAAVVAGKWRTGRGNRVWRRS